MENAMTSNFDLKGKAREFWLCWPSDTGAAYVLTVNPEHFKLPENISKSLHVISYEAYQEAIAERDKWRKMVKELYEIVAQTCMCPMTAMTNQETCKYCVARKKVDAMLGDKPEGEV